LQHIHITYNINPNPYIRDTTQNSLIGSWLCAFGLRRCLQHS